MLNYETNYSTLAVFAFVEIGIVFYSSVSLICRYPIFVSGTNLRLGGNKSFQPTHPPSNYALHVESQRGPLAALFFGVPNAVSACGKYT